MTNSEKIWEIIQNRGDISGSWRHWRSFSVLFSDELVFLTVHENFFDYTVRLIIFSKPQKQGWGNLQIFKISDYWKLDSAKDKVVSMESELKHMEGGYRDIPVLDFVNFEEYKRPFAYSDDTIEKQYESFLFRSLWEHNLLISRDEASNYLKPFDIVRINRSGGLYKHVAIYLGGNQICHFAGSSNSESSSGSDSGSMKVKKDTLRNFFGDNEKGLVNIIRPVISFKSKEKLIEHIAKTIASEYGENCYDKYSNNCEHFTFMIILGINYSKQWGGNLTPFTSQSKGASLHREIRDCDRAMEDLLPSSNSEVQDLVKEIRDLTQETNQTSYGDWEARVQVTETNINNFWCKIQ